MAMPLIMLNTKNAELGLGVFTPTVAVMWLCVQ